MGLPYACSYSKIRAQRRKESPSESTPRPSQDFSEQSSGAVAFVHYDFSMYKDVWDALGVLPWLSIGRLIHDSYRIEDDKSANMPSLMRPWSTNPDNCADSDIIFLIASSSLSSFNSLTNL